MIQQVNLYQDILKGHNHSSVNPYWAGFSAIALLCACFSGYLIWDLKKTEAQIQQLRQDLQAKQTQVNLISSKLPKQDLDTQLAAEVEHWQSMLDELTQTMQLLSDKSKDRSPGFSSFFQALSNQSTPDVWLRALYFDVQQQVISIEGSTFKPEKIPFFLQQLQKEPVFNGYSFAKLLMQQSEKIADQMDFKLSTTLDVPEHEDHAQ